MVSAIYKALLALLRASTHLRCSKQDAFLETFRMSRWLSSSNLGSDHDSHSKSARIITNAIKLKSTRISIENVFFGLMDLSSSLDTKPEIYPGQNGIAESRLLLLKHSLALFHALERYDIVYSQESKMLSMCYCQSATFRETLLALELCLKKEHTFLLKSNSDGLGHRSVTIHPLKRVGNFWIIDIEYDLK